jgi:CheY-like chemotaxis protein
VRVVASGEEALAELAAAGEPYGLMLMDLHLSGMSGLEASRRLRAELPAERQPFLVALTAAVTPEDRAACRAAGMDDFLAKPIREADLRAVLLRAAAPRPARWPP